MYMIAYLCQWQAHLKCDTDDILPLVHVVVPVVLAQCPRCKIHKRARKAL
jgi:hypothetical protein